MLQMTSAECIENNSGVAFTVLVLPLISQRVVILLLVESWLSVKYWAVTLEIKCLNLDVGKASENKNFYLQTETFT